MSNHLKNQSSPYLLQHAENPVDWYPWCEDAFEKAKREDKPVFLSVGYSTCHWCHVMAHESFEDEEIAGILNKFYISVKVDREERPDIDSVYMSVCQTLTGSGGWPMSIFMTAEQKPFFAGTYFPPASRYGMIGFRELLLTIAENWRQKREVLLQSADKIIEHISSGRDFSAGESSTEEEDIVKIGDRLAEQAASLFAESFDRKNGGFGRAPKFPVPHNLIFLTLYSKLNRDASAMEQVKFTLQKMRRGGIFDQIGYGFSRYSTDEYYLVPHFEKMLYDNALLIMAYAVAYKASGEQEFLDTAEKTALYVLREMTGEEGQFYSAQDADSEGEEGKYYVWGYQEVLEILGETQGRRFCGQYGMTQQGNFEGKNIPNLLQMEGKWEAYEIERQKLYDYRKERGSLHLDDKVLTAWNALMMGAMALLLLYEVTGKESYLKRAEQMCREAECQFADKEGGGYFLYGMKHSSLITRPKETYDGAFPSGNAVMAYCLVRLLELTGEEKYQEDAKRQLAFLAATATDYPAAHSVFLIALLKYCHPAEKITVVLAKGDDRRKILTRLPLLADVKVLDEETEEYRRKNGETTYYVCKNYVCKPPESNYEEKKIDLKKK